jgi:hypothetical protein
MPQLIMLSSREGSPDGIRTQWYLEGKTYDITPSLAAIFLKEGWACDPDALPAAEAVKPRIEPTPKAEYSSQKKKR